MLLLVKTVGDGGGGRLVEDAHLVRVRVRVRLRLRVRLRVRLRLRVSLTRTLTLTLTCSSSASGRLRTYAWIDCALSPAAMAFCLLSTSFVSKSTSTASPSCAWYHSAARRIARSLWSFGLSPGCRCTNVSRWNSFENTWNLVRVRVRVRV